MFFIIQKQIDTKPIEFNEFLFTINLFFSEFIDLLIRFMESILNLKRGIPQGIPYLKFKYIYKNSAFVIHFAYSILKDKPRDELRKIFETRYSLIRRIIIPNVKANHLNDLNEIDYTCRPLDEFVYSFNSTQLDIMEIPSFIFSKAISKEMIRIL